MCSVKETIKKWQLHREYYLHVQFWNFVYRCHGNAIDLVISTMLWKANYFSSYVGSSMFCTDRPGSHSFRRNSKMNVHAESARTGACAD